MATHLLFLRTHLVGVVVMVICAMRAMGSACLKAFGPMVVGQIQATLPRVMKIGGHEMSRPNLSYDVRGEAVLRDAVSGASKEEFVERLKGLARSANVTSTIRRMASGAALAEAVNEAPLEEVEQLLNQRSRLGFEGVTDFIYGLQSVVTAALRREELRPLAEKVLRGVVRRANRETGAARENARLFALRMRAELRT